jgi:DNA processing protein
VGVRALTLLDPGSICPGLVTTSRTIRRGEAGYPSRLARVPDAPPELRVRGELATPPARVAIVGARLADAYGLELARELARDLARAGVSVVSGGAQGIDAAAHEGALAAGGHTVAVFGCGLDVTYPAEHEQLFARIIESGGALVSEWEDAREAARWTFPRRNRIVAGMSDAVVVVRAGKKSGALLTAELARANGTPLFAVPGDVTNPLSAGPISLLRAGARMAASAADVLADLGLAPGQLTLPGEATPELAGAEKTMYAALHRAPRHADELARETGLGAGPALAALLELELSGLCEQRPGHYFLRRP